MPVAIYCRFSSELQRGNQSIQAQEAACREFLARRDDLAGEPVEVFTDEAESGATFNRPGFRALEERIRNREFKAVLVFKFDRFGRNALESEQLIREFAYRGCAVLSATEPDHELTRWILAGIAQQFRRDLADRCRRAARQSAENGFWTSFAPFGYRRVKVRVADGPRGERTRLEVVPETAALVVRIFEMFGRRRMGIKTIAATLNEEGVKSPRGGTWDASTVRTILRNPLYLGKRVALRWQSVRTPQGKKVGRRRPAEDRIIRDCPELAIVPPKLAGTVTLRLEATARIRKTRDDKAAAGFRRSKYLLSGLFVCGECGGYHIAERAGGPKEKDHVYLACSYHRRRGDAVCRNDRRVSMGEAEELVLEGIERLLFNPPAIERLVTLTGEALEAQTKTAGMTSEGIRRELADIDTRIGRLVAALEGGEEALPEVKARLLELREQKAALEGRLRDVKKVDRPTGRAAILDGIRARLGKLRETFARVRERTAPATEAVRQALAALIESAKLYADGRMEVHLKKADAALQPAPAFIRLGLATPRMIAQSTSKSRSRFRGRRNTPSRAA